MRKLTLLIGAMLFAAAPAFAADEAMAPATAPAAETPAITSQAPNSPTAAEGNSAVSPMRKGKMLRSKGMAPRKHMIHKVHAKVHHKTTTAAPAAAPAAAPEAPAAQ